MKFKQSFIQYLCTMILMDVIEDLKEAILLPLEYLSDSSKRTQYVYLISSLVMATFIYFRMKDKKGWLRYIFNYKVWFSKSSLTDYLVLIFNGFVKVFLIAPFVVLGVYLQHLTFNGLESLFGEFPYEVHSYALIAMYTFFIWIVGDFASFYLHYLMHKIPWLWEFHKTHHSATVLNPFTQYRIHPVELFLVNIKGFVVYGIVTGVFFYMSNKEVGTLTFIGVNVFKFVFLFFGANLRHSHVKLTFFNWLEYLLISPYQHQIHHSDNQKHFNKNLGSHLAIWDWLFGTLLRSKEVEEVQFGLGEEENKEFSNFWKSIITPFKNFLKIVTAK